MAAKIQKLENQFTTDGSAPLGTKSSIFNGIAIFVNGYTGTDLQIIFSIFCTFSQLAAICYFLDPTSDVLKRLMQQHGGVFHHYYSRSKVTHIIATNLPNSKIENLTDKKVCHPRWITERLVAVN